MDVWQVGFVADLGVAFVDDRAFLVDRWWVMRRVDIG